MIPSFSRVISNLSHILMTNENLIFSSHHLTFLIMEWIVSQDKSKFCPTSEMQRTEMKTLI